MLNNFSRVLEYDPNFDGDEWAAINGLVFIAYLFVLTGLGWILWAWWVFPILLMISGLHLTFVLFVAYKRTTKSNKR